MYVLKNKYIVLLITISPQNNASLFQNFFSFCDFLIRQNLQIGGSPFVNCVNCNCPFVNNNNNIKKKVWGDFFVPHPDSFLGVAFSQMFEEPFLCIIKKAFIVRQKPSQRGDHLSILIKRFPPFTIIDDEFWYRADILTGLIPKKLYYFEKYCSTLEQNEDPKENSILFVYV